MRHLALACVGLVFALALLDASTHARTQASPDAAYAGDAASGKRLYVANGCYACHNYNGSGGRHGPRLSQNTLTAAAFIAFVRRPRTMPPYSAKVMSDREVTDVWAYIRTFPEPPPVSSLPLLTLDCRRDDRDLLDSVAASTGWPVLASVESKCQWVWRDGTHRRLRTRGDDRDWRDGRAMRPEGRRSGLWSKPRQPAFPWND